MYQMSLMVIFLKCMPLTDIYVVSFCAVTVFIDLLIGTACRCYVNVVSLLKQTLIKINPFK